MSLADLKLVVNANNLSTVSEDTATSPMVSIALPGIISKGMYVLELADGVTKSSTRFVKQ